MQVYVAGRFRDWRAVRVVQEVLRREGHAVICDWTVHAEAGANERDGSMSQERMAAVADTDLCAARDAGLLVLVCCGDMADALGCYVELGAALAVGRDVHVIAPPRWSIFYSLPQVSTFASVDAWKAAR